MFKLFVSINTAPPKSCILIKWANTNSKLLRSKVHQNHSGCEAYFTLMFGPPTESSQGLNDLEILQQDKTNEGIVNLYNSFKGLQQKSGKLSSIWRHFCEEITPRLSKLT